MPQNKTIKFFISSTFKDFEGERNILQKFVFPKLKMLCHEKGFGFQPIDLRWGVKEEAGYDQQTMNICLNEIRRSSSEPKPNLLLLIGQRYGWVPIPYDIEEKDFKKIIESNKLKKEEVDLIETWYQEDQNYKDTKFILKDKWQYKDDRDAWSEIENKLRDAFQKVVDESFGDDVYNKFHKSATEQEMYEGLDAFDKTKNHDHTYAYFREIENHDINLDEVQDYIDTDITRLDNLKNRLQDERIIPKENQLNGDNAYKVDWSQIEEAKKIKYEDLTLENASKYLKKFHDDILYKFTESITKEIDKYNQNKPTPLIIELEQQKLFLEKKSEVVLGRDTEIENIKQFLADDNQQYYLQYGRSGTGKTSVMAKAISEIDNTQFEVIYRFIGTTESSTYSRQVFENILWEIESKIKEDPKLPALTFEYEDDKFKKQFKEQLKKLEDKQVIIFLDALDQFEDYNDLTILLDELPSNIKIVFSTLYDEEKKDNPDYIQYFNRLNYLKTKYELLPIEENYNKEILKAWLESKNRELTDTQWEYIQPFIQNITPLHLRLIFEIVKHWTSEQIILQLEDTQERLIIQFFNLVQKQYHHENELLVKALGYISASKDGLSEEELLELFSNDKEFLKLFQNYRYPELDRLPNAIWSRFYYYIQDIFTEKLIDGEMLISPYHRIIEEVIKDNFRNTKILSNYTENLLELSIFKSPKSFQSRYLKLCINSCINFDSNSKNKDYYSFIINGIKTIDNKEWLLTCFKWFNEIIYNLSISNDLIKANMYGYIFYYITEFNFNKSLDFRKYYFVAAMMLLRIYNKQNKSEKSKYLYNQIGLYLEQTDKEEIFKEHFEFWINYQKITAELYFRDLKQDKAIECLLHTIKIIKKHPNNSNYKDDLDSFYINLDHYGYQLDSNTFLEVIEFRKNIFEKYRKEIDALNYFNVLVKYLEKNMDSNFKIYLAELERLTKIYHLNISNKWFDNYCRYNYLTILYKYYYKEIDQKETTLLFEELILESKNTYDKSIRIQILKTYVKDLPHENNLKVKKYFSQLIHELKNLNKYNDSNKNTEQYLEGIINYIEFLKKNSLLSIDDENFFIESIKYFYDLNLNYTDTIIIDYINFYLNPIGVKEIEKSNILSFIDIVINDGKSRKKNISEQCIRLINEIASKYFNEKNYREAAEYFNISLDFRERNFFKYKFNNYKDYLISIKNLDFTARYLQNEELLIKTNKTIYNMLMGVFLDKKSNEDKKLKVYYFVLNEFLIKYYCNNGYINECITILKKVILSLGKRRRKHFFNLVNSDLKFIIDQVKKK